MPVKPNLMRLSVFLVAMILFLAIDCLVFRTGFYGRYLKLQSAAGVYQYKTKLGNRRSASDKKLIAVLGDSRISEGFSSKVFDQDVENKSWHALNLGMPGSTPRVWHYFLCQVDPGLDRFKEIVIPLTSYWDFEENDFDNPSERILDLQFFAPFASFANCVDAALTYNDETCREEAFLCGTLKMYAMRRDIRDFFQNPEGRLSNLRINRDFEICDYNYQGNRERLSEKLKLSSLGSKDKEIINRLRERVEMQLPEQTGNRYRYNRYWLNRIVQRYRYRGTRVVFVKVPSDPIKRNYAVPKNHSAIEELSKSEPIIMTSEHLFDDLQKPACFYDDLHMNNVGRKNFSHRLAQLLPELVETKESIAQNVSRHSVSQ